MESFASADNSRFDYDFEDFDDKSFYNLLLRLPRELGIRHLATIVERNMSDNEATNYLEGILEARKEAVTETEIGDEQARELFEGQFTEMLHLLETDTLTREGNFLGSGQTAQIKQFNLTKGDKTIPMAIKYLMTPTAKTLSASAEYDMIKEVERIHEIEVIEESAHLKQIGVPHPYFHHRNSRIQCYGMQLINGSDLEVAIDDMKDNRFSSEIAEIVSHLDVDELMSEVDIFFKKMHTYCLHGDIKPKNIMVDETGKFFIIDFGQSLLVNDMTESTRDQFENIMEDEIKKSKEILRGFIKRAKLSLAPEN
ncbi:hypothetical protein H6789_02525 [Candidatus Nomurabacteria bacterium]|nr:hypothetical protein [Candidatus Kaiserbacteria bacterium]MCB9815332.1 hypothetical protein [Candidatus Nomurabacteria bacterium]MCB9819555.1 hypothetical protein [Candidatus Nomurabacteria bacterium]